MKAIIDQTVALFYDAYRELNSKKMFWFTLILSGVVVLSFLAVGITREHKLSVFGMGLLELPPEMNNAVPYKFLFSRIGIGVWLTWAAMILAIVSTASIFPDFMSGG